MKIEKVYTSFDHTSSETEFYNARFEKCVFSHTDHTTYEFHDCVFHNCNCASMPVEDCIFDNILFEGCKLSGVHFGGVNNFLFSASFLDSMLDFALFEKNNLTHSMFDKCSIREACFTETNLKSVTFRECDLHRTLFERSNIEKADFTTARNYFIDLDKNRVKGALFSLPEALNLLYKYDITIL
jgi:fluoroquinolone resistance protein